MKLEKKIKIELSLLLPAIPDDRDRCVSRLISSLKGRPGILNVHIDQDPNGKDRLCVHYDSDLISLARVREFVETQGAELTDRFGHFSEQISSVMDSRRTDRISMSLKEIPGVIEVSISPLGSLSIEFDRKLVKQNDIRSAVLSRLSSETLKITEPHKVKKHEEHAEEDHGGIFGTHAELIFSILAGLLLLLGWSLNKFNFNPNVVLFLFLCSYFFGGFFALREAIENIKLRRLEIDSLMLLAASGAAFLGEWPEGSLLLTLFSFGHALEHFAMGRARKAIEALAQLAPDTAFAWRGSEFIEISVDEIRVDDRILVKPNERLPVDGFVVRGESSIDQSAVTGESIPVDKLAVSSDASDQEKLDSKHRVFAGTINGAGLLEVQVTNLASESTLSKVIQTVNEAEARKSPTQIITDRFEKRFVPTVLILVAFLPLAFLLIDEAWQISFYRAMAVLVAASPCALAIATPSAVLSAVARAAKGGVLVKGGAPLEELGALTAIAFDKTGTLTEGRPRVTDLIPFNGVMESELLSVAVAVEKMSDHPLAAAIVRHSQEQAMVAVDRSLIAENVQSVTGKGVTANIGQESVLIGKRKMFSKEEMSLENYDRVMSLEQKGRTVMIVKRGVRFLGVIGLRDTPRKGVVDVIKSLREIGIKEMIVLSGDNQSIASEVARELGLSHAQGDLMPEDKVRIVTEMKGREKVAMVGDGVNDAPAMTQATVAIAMGAAGSDVALQTSDVALMADDLSALPFAVALSRKTRVIVRQNLWVSLGVVAFLVPATFMGLKIGAVVALHEGSTLIVVFNALRLLGFGWKPD